MDHADTLALMYYPVHQTILSLQYQQKLKAISLFVLFSKLLASLVPTSQLAYHMVQVFLPSCFYRLSRECC